METKDLLGKTLTRIVVNEEEAEIVLTTSCGKTYRYQHDQDCCESVDIEDINGDLEDLLNEPLLVAEESVSSDETPEGVTPPEYEESFTWTFYKFATKKGHVVIRWFGVSNGYYSEEVNLYEI